MTKLTPRQREVLLWIAEHGALDGVCIRYRWTFKIGSDTATAEVKRLQFKGLVEVSYYRGGNASATLTDGGRGWLYSNVSGVELAERGAF